MVIVPYYLIIKYYINIWMFNVAWKIFKASPASGKKNSRWQGVIVSCECARWYFQRLLEIIWVCLKMLCTPKPNGFHDHYP